MIASKIKTLRKKRKMTQQDIATYLGISRSSVNAWERGDTTPSLCYVIELALLFDVSSDYLLGIDRTSTINVEGLNEREISVIIETLECFKRKHALGA